MEGISELCRTHDVIYISDEVQTGFGKCGTLFGYQRSNARPDILTCSKAWGGGLPLAFVLYSSRLGGLPHSGTFRGNQMALHLGTLCLEHLFAAGVLHNVAGIERFWHDAAHEVRALGGVVAVRSVGALVGIEFVTSERSEKVFQELLEHGVLCKRAGREKRTLVFWMMLNLTEEICTVVLDALKNAIASTC